MRSVRLPAALTLIAAVALPAAPAAGAPDPDVQRSKKLRQGVKVKGIMEHQTAFQTVANNNGSTRAAATPGYDASVQYVGNRLRAAGYKVTFREFDFPSWTENSPAQLSQVTPTAKDYPAAEFITAQFSGSGNLTAQIVPIDVVLPPTPDPSSTSGCEAADFPADVSGNIALIQRGTCTFVAKIANAKAAGAAAVLIFNEGQPGRTDPIEISAQPDTDIPVLMTSFATGNELAQADAQPGGATAKVVTDTTTTPRAQINVLADSHEGDPNRTVVVGGHLDSVEAGAGINDNGSGSSTILEIAEEMSKLNQKPRNRVRFAFWGAEEAGLIGSTAYVAQLSAEERAQIMANLNFDMLGSPNFVRFVYDGDTSDTPPPPGGAPAGSGAIEGIFNSFFASQGLASDPTAFDGRSDYGPFIAQGIPAGGLFSGAEGEKTAEQAILYGGTADAPYDPCYHQACDTIANLNPTALDHMSDAAAHATWTLARFRGNLATGAKNGKKGVPLERFAYTGPFANR